MSGPAAAAGASKVSAFINHPAGESLNRRHGLGPSYVEIPRSQDRVLLGPPHEMVLGRCGAEGHEPTC